jgi:propanol-preferring alcohol dehydrogenase
MGAGFESKFSLAPTRSLCDRVCRLHRHYLPDANPRQFLGAPFQTRSGAGDNPLNTSAVCAARKAPDQNRIGGFHPDRLFGDWGRDFESRREVRKVGASCGIIFDVKAAVLREPGKLSIEDVPKPGLSPGQVLLKVRACGVCRTDLHILDGDLPFAGDARIPGHQIVGEIVDGGTAELLVGTRVGVSWLGGIDGTCSYCRNGMENLCDAPVFTGYSVDGGYAEYAVANSDFVYALPAALDDLHAAPLLCAGIIGFRSLRVAGVEPGDRVGLFGFGSSAHLIISVLHALHCTVYVATRGAAHRSFAAELGAVWVGSETAKPPVELDRAITFAPSGQVVVAALASLRKGGVVAINAIHLDKMPEFSYDQLLWGERQIRSVTNMTRSDAKDFLQLAADIGLTPKATVFGLDRANEALEAIRTDALEGSAVIVPGHA